MKNRVLRRTLFVGLLGVACLATEARYGLKAFQVALFVITIVWFCFRYFSILDLILQFAINNVLLVGLIVGFYAAMSGLYGSSYGVMNLFWHEDLGPRIGAGFCSSLFFGLLFVAAFYNDTQKRATQARLKAYLDDDRYLSQMAGDTARWSVHNAKQVYDWLRWRGWTASPPPTPVGPPDVSVQDCLKRFLKFFHHPFAWLLMLPALAPTLFIHVSTAVPDRLRFFGYSYQILPIDENDVTTHRLAWLIGVAIWGLGVWAGRFAIWAFVEINRRCFGILDRATLNDPTLSSMFDPVMGWICPLPKAEWRSARSIIYAATVCPIPYAVWPIDEAELARSLWRKQVHQAVSRYIILVFAVYFLGIACYLFLGAGTSADSEQRIGVASQVGLLIFLAAFILLIRFLRVNSPAIREENLAEGAAGRRHLREHIALTSLLGIGLAMAGLGSAVFQVFVVLAILAIGVIIVNRYSDSWNWPLKAIPLRVVIPILLVNVLWVVNSSPSKLRIPGLESNYQPTRVDIQQVVEANLYVTPEDDLAVLKAWEQTVKSRPALSEQRRDGKPKLAVMAVTGGANRSALWTAAVLDKLESINRTTKQPELPDFLSRLRLITGASGGMVGAAYYVARWNEMLDNPSADTPKPLVDEIPRDSLSPVVRQWILGDVPASFWPFDLKQSWDRGTILERTWPRLRIPFSTLAVRELKGEIPSLLLSPMFVEDGRQLLISNLNLRFLTSARGNLGVFFDELYSYPSVELFKLFPAARDRFEVATAVRLNASFPYVSPAPYLPTTPYRRVVDAGYYDNFGVSIAAAWLYHHRDWIKEHTSGVVLIQVRAYPSQLSRTVLQPPEASPLKVDSLSRSFEFVTSPGVGAASSRDASTLFRNDQVLDAIGKWFGDHRDDPDFFTTIIFENVLDVAMTWSTTEKELDSIKKGFDVYHLKLMPGLEDVKSIPDNGNDEIVVAEVGGTIHLRLFDSNGKQVVDTDEENLIDSYDQVAHLKEHLKDMWPPHKLSDDEADHLISNVTSIVGHARNNRSNLRAFRDLKQWWVR